MATFEIEYPKDALVITSAAPRAQPAMAHRLMHAAAMDSVALRTFVLGTADERTYRYRVTLIYADARAAVSIPDETDWLQSTDTTLRPRLAAGPSM